MNQLRLQRSRRELLEQYSTSTATISPHYATATGWFQRRPTRDEFLATVGATPTAGPG